MTWFYGLGVLLAAVGIAVVLTFLKRRRDNARPIEADAGRRQVVTRFGALFLGLLGLSTLPARAALRRGAKALDDEFDIDVRLSPAARRLAQNDESGSDCCTGSCPPSCVPTCTESCNGSCDDSCTPTCHNTCPDSCMGTCGGASCSPTSCGSTCSYDTCGCPPPPPRR